MMSHWLLLYLLLLSLLLMPVLLSHYGPRIRRRARHIRSWAARLKRRAVAALRRRLWRWLTEPPTDDAPDGAPPATPLHPRP